MKSKTIPNFGRICGRIHVYVWRERESNQQKNRHILSVFSLKSASLCTRIQDIEHQHQHQFHLLTQSLSLPWHNLNARVYIF